MEEHIIALLKNNLRVIIPDFGAFIVRQKEPEVIVFNEFLRYNDGLLIDYISKFEQIEKEIAEQKVSEFAEESAKALESGKTLHIKGLGSLLRDPSGKINFTEEATGDKKARPEIKKEGDRKARKKPVGGGSVESSGTDRIKKKKAGVSTEPDDEATKKTVVDDSGKEGAAVRKTQKGRSDTKSDDQQQDKPEIKQVAKSEDNIAVNTEPKKKPDDKMEEKPHKKTEDVPVVKVETEAEDKASSGAGKPPDSIVNDQSGKVQEVKPVTVSVDNAASSQPEEAKSDQKSSVKTQPGKQAEERTYKTLTAKPLPTPTPKKSNTINQILAWIGIFLVANIIVLAWFLYRDQIKNFFNREKGTEVIMDSLFVEEQAEPVFQITTEDTAPVVESVPAMEVPVPLPVRTDQPKYYIVAGCFREETNADALVQSLQSQGYQAEKFGNIGNLHAVSYAAFDNQVDALKELERIRQQEQPDAWMTRF